jgi:hypothetical protein
MTDELLWETVSELREEANKLETIVNDETRDYIVSNHWNADEQEYETIYTQTGDKIWDLIEFIRLIVIKLNIRYKQGLICL